MILRSLPTSRYNFETVTFDGSLIFEELYQLLENCNFALAIISRKDFLLQPIKLLCTSIRLCNIPASSPTRCSSCLLLPIQRPLRTHGVHVLQQGHKYLAYIISDLADVDSFR